jgi:ssDNA-binding Zn-finger/Zn-ribbon topoisomerase 1
MERANEGPIDCPFCGNKTFVGALTGKRQAHRNDRPAGEGLLFQGADQPGEQRKGLGKRLLSKIVRGKSWWLPGAQVKCRSCGKCKRLFLWGVIAEDAVAQQPGEENGERYCPHCSAALNSGQIVLKANHEEGARFTCDDAPDFHRDWIGHNLLDRFVYNHWNPALKSLPAHSCPDCQYTEVAGRPIYRFL